MPRNFRALDDHEAAAAYEVYMRAFSWLTERQVRQWLIPTSKQAFDHYAVSGELFGLFTGQFPVAVGRLAYEKNPHWSEELGEDKLWWLSLLSSNRGHAEVGSGRTFLCELFAYLETRTATALFLDCVNNREALPTYYRSCGFQRLAEKAVTYQSGNDFPMVLLTAPVPNPALQRGPGACGAQGEGAMSLHPGEILITPVVSEKSYGQIVQNRYTFKVHPDAHKTQIRQAVEQLFDVSVVRVNVVKVQPKPKRRGTTRGTRSGWKKAIVQLKPGDSIEIFEGAQL